MVLPRSTRAEVSSNSFSTTLSAQLSPHGPRCPVCFQATSTFQLAGRTEEEHTHSPLGSFLEVRPITTISNLPKLCHTDTSGWNVFILDCSITAENQGLQYYGRRQNWYSRTTSSLSYNLYSYQLPLFDRFFSFLVFVCLIFLFFLLKGNIFFFVCLPLIKFW